MCSSMLLSCWCNFCVSKHTLLAITSLLNAAFWKGSPRPTRCPKACITQPDTWKNADVPNTVSNGKQVHDTLLVLSLSSPKLSLHWTILPNISKIIFFLYGLWKWAIGDRKACKCPSCREDFMRSPPLCPTLMVPTPYKNLTSRTWNLPTATTKPWALFCSFSFFIQ